VSGDQPRSDALVPPSRLFALLDQLQIAYDRYDHAPVHTCEQAEAEVPNVDAVQTKNLFLRDKRGRRHLLLVTSCTKAVDLKAFCEQAGADNLSFASPERLTRYLGVEPGSVTVLGLFVDSNRAVELFVDADVWQTPRWRCHPMVNSATLVLTREAIEAFLVHTGHRPTVVTLGTRSVSGNP
jgi:Ala-tRNA(Pro) deacylase